MVVLLLGGIVAFTQLGQDEDPPFTFRAMVVRAFWPGATAQQMAEQVTDKLERKLQETPFIDKINSYSKPGETLIFVNLADSSPPREIAQVWYQVRNVAKVDLFGVQDERVYIEIAHKRLAQLGLNVQSLIEQIGAQNAIEPAGVLNLPTDDLQIRISGEFRNVDD